MECVIFGKRSSIPTVGIEKATGNGPAAVKFQDVGSLNF